jgi:phasin family protein
MLQCSNGRNASMADNKSDTQTANAETAPKVASAPAAPAPAARTAPAEAPAAVKAPEPQPKAEKAAEPAPKAVKAPEPAPQAEKAAKPAPAPAATAPKAARVAAVKAAPARRRGRKPVPVTTRPATAGKVTTQKKPAAKPAATQSVKAAARRPAAKAARPAFQALNAKTLNEGSRTMKNETSKITDRVQAAFGDVNVRAKEAFERNTKVAEELTDFTKGNVEALVASSKLVAKGAETLGQEVAEFGRKSFEDASAALKSFAEVKSPADLFRLQSEFARAQFDAFVAESSKLSETVLKLAGEVAEPINSRYAVAAEKAKAVVAF